MHERIRVADAIVGDVVAASDAAAREARAEVTTTTRARATQQRAVARRARNLRRFRGAIEPAFSEEEMPFDIALQSPPTTRVGCAIVFHLAPLGPTPSAKYQLEK